MNSVEAYDLQVEEASVIFPLSNSYEGFKTSLLKGSESYICSFV
ncbi:hypothetical protein [uncultured Clostridium sp.]|jgi:hypothetical protein|nr:hypothetical protein [uncultured Clostridium sp.]